MPEWNDERRKYLTEPLGFRWQIDLASKCLQSKEVYESVDVDGLGSDLLKGLEAVAAALEEIESRGKTVDLQSGVIAEMLIKESEHEQRIKELEEVLTRIGDFKHTSHCECSCEGDTEAEIAQKALL